MNAPIVIGTLVRRPVPARRQFRSIISRCAGKVQAMTNGPAEPGANLRLRGRRIYVTGAASGIGRATAQLLAREGAALALVDVNADALAKVADETGGLALVLDLTDGDAIDRSVAEAGRALGGLDGVINCAGVA